ncbi:MAG TPA: RHS repeat-associated core domain-containing protein [Cyclobacteriaceae bacterium]|nr:RHS repeat-associated core domain-containing protein [Cyclobacteriaceae bacterium]
MTQDGEQRKAKKWSFTKYDEFNRPIITGLYTLRATDAPLDQQAMSDLISTTNIFETYNGDTNNHGYTNTVFSTTNFPGVFEVLTVAYFDNYDFKDNVATRILTDAQYNYKSDEYPEQYKFDANGNSFPKVKGKVTGTKTKNLGDNTYLWGISYYDNRYLIVQTVADNVRGDVDRSTSVYDFVGKVHKTKTTHNIKSGSPQTITRTFEYDHTGRFSWVKHSVNGSTDVVLIKNEYNELGQLVDKKLHSTNTDATDAKQSIDYRYNIRGWLTNVNDMDEPEASDLFSMSLNYNAPTTLGGAAQYNGNISEVLWKGPDSKANSYGYTYDQMNRLVEAKYYNAADPLQNGRFNEKIWDEANNKSGYDLNGNIKFLNRNGKTGIDALLGITTYGQMDNLTYTYTGNQLLKVNEAGTKTQGFIDGANIDDDYLYSANGNMYYDKNKSITGETTVNGNSVITYNHLNLPEKIVKSTGEYIKYSYDATGRKLRQEVYDVDNNLKKKTDYLGEFFYENDTLKFINHEEGRVVMTGSQPEYQYHLKDHLGNVRVTFTSKEEQEEKTATLETAALDNEKSNFLNIDKARRINSAIFDHTYNNQTPPADGAFAVRLSGTTTDGQTKEKIGLIRSLSVMPGDKITLEVYAKYVDLNNSNVNSTVRSLVTSIATGTATAGTVIDGNHYGSSDASTFPHGGDLADEKANDTHGGPKAYLNYLVFDKDFNFISSKSGYKKVTTEAQEDGNTITSLNPDGKSHQQLTASIDIAEAGYVYIYLSNEEETPVEVYFDDFKVAQVKSPIIQSEDYYPFGLTYNSFSRENSTKQNFLFNGKEMQDELNLGWLDYGARMYEPEIARWGVIDPLTDASRRWSPYNYAFDNPIRFVDPDGMQPVDESELNLLTKFGLATRIQGDDPEPKNGEGNQGNGNRQWVSEKQGITNIKVTPHFFTNGTKNDKDGGQITHYTVNFTIITETQYNIVNSNGDVIGTETVRAESDHTQDFYTDGKPIYSGSNSEDFNRFNIQYPLRGVDKEYMVTTSASAIIKTVTSIMDTHISVNSELPQSSRMLISISEKIGPIGQRFVYHDEYLKIRNAVLEMDRKINTTTDQILRWQYHLNTAPYKNDPPNNRLKYGNERNHR